jgi:K+-transporting ATPase c subunit
MKSIYQAGILLMMMTLISGILYPAVLTSIGQLIWPDKSNGSMVKKNNEIVGSALIAQQFKACKWTRSTYLFRGCPHTGKPCGERPRLG